MEVRALSPGLGAEIVGIDLCHDQPPPVRDAVVAAWREHHLVLLRDQRLTAAQHVDFARWFGPIRPPDRLVHPDLPADADHSHLSNTRGDGTGGTAEVMRHQDFTWTVPLRALSLYAIEVPAVGGDTIFYNSELALSFLDAGLRAQAEELRAVHFDRYAAARTHRAADPLEAEHPVVLKHPDTGANLLFVDEQTTKHLVGVSGAEAISVLNRLLAVFDRPEVQYIHRWRVGDVIVWDNLSLQHSRTPFPADQPRTLRRIQID